MAFNKELREQIKVISKQISRLRNNLAKTDYKAIKYAEGELTDTEYAETLAQRREWRAEINALQVQIKELMATSRV